MRPGVAGTALFIQDLSTDVRTFIPPSLHENLHSEANMATLQLAEMSMAEFDQLEPEARLSYLRTILNSNSSHTLDHAVLTLSKSSAQIALDQVWKVSFVVCTPPE